MTDKDIAAYLGWPPRHTAAGLTTPEPTINATVSSHEKGEVERKATLVGRIMDASGDSWQAAAWLLERKYPQEYAKAQRIMDTTDTAVLKAPRSWFCPCRPQSAGTSSRCRSRGCKASISPTARTDTT
mgnify:CR=1 FL=1